MSVWGGVVGGRRGIFTGAGEVFVLGGGWGGGGLTTGQQFY